MLWCSLRNRGNRSWLPGGSAFRGRTKNQPRGGFTPECDFRSVHPIHARSAARRTPGRHNHLAGQKTQLHQAPRYIFRKVQTVQDSRFPSGQLGQSFGCKSGISPSMRVVVDTQLHRAVSFHRSLKHAEVPRLLGKSHSTDSIADLFSPRYTRRKKNFIANILTLLRSCYMIKLR